MTSSAVDGSTKVWDAIDRERRVDRMIRRVSIVAWSLTILLTLAYGVIMGMQLMHLRRLVSVGAAPAGSVAEAATPLVIVLGVISLLVATLATVGVFLRLRTASLSEVQLRLAALEEILARQGDAR